MSIYCSINVLNLPNMIFAQIWNKITFYLDNIYYNPDDTIINYIAVLVLLFLNFFPVSGHPILCIPPFDIISIFILLETNYFRSNLIMFYSC